VNPTRVRISADERREQILQAAREQFGSTGYVGTTTDQIARAAGISQPYVVRMFGTKEQLFVQVLQRACAEVLESFRAAAVGVAPADMPRALGEAYIDLVTDSGLLRTLAQGFLSGADPVIGPVAREGFLRIYRFLRDEAHLQPEMLAGFLSHGMLINTVLNLELLRSPDPDADELVRVVCGEKAPLVELALRGVPAAR
jgi:TetR/AcrR family transcriptional regulator